MVWRWRWPLRTANRAGNDHHCCRKYAGRRGYAVARDLITQLDIPVAVYLVPRVRSWKIRNPGVKNWIMCRSVWFTATLVECSCSSIVPQVEPHAPEAIGELICRNPGE